MSPRLLSRALLPCVIGLLPACGAPEPPSGDYPDVTRDGGTTADTGSSDVVVGDELMAGGTWMMWYETSTCVQVLSVAIETVTQTLQLASVEQEPGGVLRHKIRNCRVEQTPILGVTTTIPLLLVESLEPREWLGVVDGNRTGASYFSQRSTELWGLKLQDPEHEELPTAPTDPRIFDQDGDGQPGVTLDLGTNLCSMYVVQRAISQWKGKIDSAIQVSGIGNNLTTQISLGGTGGFCASQFKTTNPPDSARFVLRRVDGQHGSVNIDSNQDGVIDCEDVRAYGSEPFGPRPPDNTRCETTTP